MELEQIRNEINEIDTQMAQLFVRRMNAVLQVAEYKKENDMTVLDRSRERDVLARIAALVGEPYEAYSKILWNTLFDLSRSYQNSKLSEGSSLEEAICRAARETPPLFPSRAAVACQGIEGSYSQKACDRLFSLPTILYFNQFEGVFQAVEQGMCDYGILPIENSTAGSVLAVYDLMQKYHFHIVRSLKLKIDHSLLVKDPSAGLAQIREIVSHPQAISQCSDFLRDHPDIKITSMENTAAAARYVSQSPRTDLAAISSPACAELYGLTPILEHFQNNDSNNTRFICISKKMEIYPGADRISLMLTLPHRPASLYGLLARFAAQGFNLTKLESRPIPGRDFEFLFYFDFEASVYSPETLSLLGNLQRDLAQFTFLGSYSESV